MPNEVRGRLDTAIDRAVRGIMQVDPRPGLRHRVAERLNAPARRSWLVPAFAAAVMVAVIASVVMLRTPEPSSSATPQIVAAPPAVAPHQTAATPQPAEQPIETPPVAASAPGTPRVRRPAPSNASMGGASIFGPPSQLVTAASVGPEPGPAPAAAVDPMPMPGALEPIAPIVIEPIVITPITVTPLIVRTPDRR